MLIHILRNWIDYPLRQFVRWRRPGLKLRNEPKEHLYDHLDPAQRQSALQTAARLAADYRLDHLAAHSTCDNYRENLYYLEMLERALEASGFVPGASLNAADIGPSHWFYVQALHAGLRWWRSPQGRDVTLTAFEADPYRVYADLRSRMDHAQVHMHGLEGAVYLPQPFRLQRQDYDVVTMFFPFVFVSDHLEWGLPYRRFDPLILLSAAWHSLKPGGVLVIANQGEAEHLAQRAMLAGLGEKPGAAFRFDSRLYSYDLPRYVMTALK